ncbi:hypothetical protein AMTR_s00011p00187580, partial [Amborella trichopoda]
MTQLESERDNGNWDEQEGFAHVMPWIRVHHKEGDFPCSHRVEDEMTAAKPCERE